MEQGGNLFGTKLPQANQRLQPHLAKLHSFQQFEDHEQGQLSRCSYLNFLHWMILYCLHQLHTEALSAIAPVNNLCSDHQPIAIHQSQLYQALKDDPLLAVY
nr:hypothetical protein Iba_scaffold8881CG0070 [Ipomoea batatas]